MLLVSIVSPHVFTTPKLVIDSSVRLLSHHPLAFPLLLLPQHHVRAFIDTLLIITIHPTFTVATSHIPGIAGCYQVTSSVQLFIPFLLYFALALGGKLGACLCSNRRWQVLSPGLMALTLIRAIKSWQTTNGHLYVILLKHNISYYACGLCKSKSAHAEPYFRAHPKSLSFL